MLTRIIELQDRCCGCAACAAVCPVPCISIKVDDLGFPYPIVDPGRCIGCLKCESVCPALSSDKPEEPKTVCWAKSTDKALLLRSSSGGIFGLLARWVLDEGGIVYGAAFNGSFDAVNHIRIDDSSRLDELLRSKYVQSRLTTDLYESMCQDLKAGGRVLISGTPCQIKGIRKYLDARNVSIDRLLLIEVICHGVPSPALWRRWIQFRSELVQKKVTSVNFRSKRIGWENFSVEYFFEDGTSESIPHGDDWFMRAFLNDASIRSSCFVCPAKCSSGSDMVLGDYWGIERTQPNLDRSDGVSAVLVNTERGERALEDLCFSIESGSTSFVSVAAENSALVRSVKPYAKREAFLDDVRDALDISVLMKKWSFRKGIFGRIVTKARRMILKD